MAEVFTDCDTDTLLYLCYPDGPTCHTGARSCFLKLWNKGESSGHFLHVAEVFTDCDTDTLLYLCYPDGPTCHTGARSCFFNRILQEEAT